MKKRLVLFLSLLLAVSVLFPGCAAPPEEPTEKYIASLPPLCPKVEMEAIDLSILNDIDYLIRTQSVFTSEHFKDVFGETAEDQAFLMRAALETLFGGFLAVSKDQIPRWAIDWIEEEIDSSSYNYKVFNKIYHKLIEDSNYDYLKDPSQKEKLLKVMAEGMIKALGDPFAGYLTHEQWILTNQGSLMGTYQGMGIGLARNERGEIAVNSVVEGSPAEKAGLKPGDAIVAVDEKSALDCTFNQFTLHVKTRENPEMNLIVRRKLTDKLERVPLTLEKVTIQHLFTGPGVELPDNRGLSSKDLPFYYPLRDEDKKEHPDILYIQIKEFSFQAAIDLHHVLTNLDMAEFKGIIIDVRGNPGGRLDAIIHCADYFLLGEELITSTKWANGEITESRQNEWNLVPEDIPIAILVGKDSTSGAEMFPAALRDNGRAVIISQDERSGGKGSVNLHFPLNKGWFFWKKNYGSLYVSIGLWYTPSDEMIEKMDLDRDGYHEVGGLKPDIRVEWTDEDVMENQRNPAWYDPTIFRAIEYIETHQ